MTAGRRRCTLEATSKRTNPEFFAAHTVSELLTWSDYDLENEGRLTHPMAYDAATDRVLIPLAHHDPKSGTPSYKSMPVRVRRAA